MPASARAATPLSELGVAFHTRPEANPAQKTKAEKTRRPARLEKYVKRAKELKQRGENGARTALSELSKRREFPLQKEELDGLESKLSTESKQTVQGLRDFSTYSDVQRELRKGNKLEQILKDKNITQDQWNSARKNVLDKIAQTDVIQEILPELNDLITEQQLDHVETFLASDPELSNAVIRNTRAVIEKSEAIPEASVKPQTGERQQTLKDQQNEALARIQTRLGESGKNLTIDQVTSLLNGKSVAEVTLDIFDAALQQSGVTNPAALRSYSAFQRINTEISSLEAVAKSPNTEQANAAKTRIAELQGQRVKAELEYKSIGVTDSDLQSQLPKYQNLEQKVYGQKDPIGRVVGGIEGDLNKLAANETEIRNLEAQAKQQAPIEQKQAEARSVEQQKVAQELNQVIENSVTEVLLQRHDTLRERQAIEAEAQAKDAEKAGKDNLAKGLRIIESAKDNNWLPYKENKYQAERENIGRDMKYLADNGDEGLRRLFLRDLSGNNGVISLEGITVKNADGKEIPATWENVSWEQLPEESHQLLNEVYDKQSGSYLDNLFSSYYIARQPRGIRDAFKLGQSKDIFKPKGDEFKRLRALYGEHIQAGSKKAEKFNNINQELKQKGINPESSMGFLLAIAALFGGLSKDEEVEYSEDMMTQAA